MTAALSTALNQDRSAAGSDPRPSVCFVSLNNYGMLSGEPHISHIGGAEVQQMHLARGLIARGYPVCFVTLDHGQPDGTELDGIRVFKAYATDAGLPGIRFFHPRLSGLWNAMRRSNAVVYYQRMAEETTGIVAAFCRRHHRRFIFSCANDWDCLLDPPHMPRRLDRVLFRYGLRRADGVIAQTCVQQRSLSENFGVRSTVIPNCSSVRTETAAGQRCDSDVPPTNLLWVGRFSEQKRLDMLLDIAQECDDKTFEIVGDGNSGSEYVRRLRERANALANVRLCGYVPHAEMSSYYRRAAALVCTSLAEGFPNIFLEAWSHGVPVISTFDPDDLVDRNGLGVVVPNAPSMITAIRHMFDEPAAWRRMCVAAKQYYYKNHTVDAVLPQLEQVFRDACGLSASSSCPMIRPEGQE